MISVAYGNDGSRLVKKLLSDRKIAKKLHPQIRVGIKPNLVVAKPSDQGATTDPAIVCGIIEFLQENQVTDITIMESSWLGDCTERAFDVCGYRSLARSKNVELLDLKRDKAIEKRVAELSLWICESALNVDYLINVPVLKAHCQTKLTCALKNLKGCIPDKEKRRYHKLGLHKPIAALSLALPQHLVVVDGIIGDLCFEEGGTPVVMNRILVSEDPVAMDSYCASLLGYFPWEIPYIPLAVQYGVGSTNFTVQETETSSREIPKSTPLTSKYKDLILQDKACSACLGSTLHALERLFERGEKLSSKLFIGQGFLNTSQEGLGIGNCTKNLSTYVPGCPVTAKDILTYLASHPR